MAKDDKKNPSAPTQLVGGESRSEQGSSAPIAGQVQGDPQSAPAAVDREAIEAKIRAELAPRIRAEVSAEFEDRFADLEARLQAAAAKGAADELAKSRTEAAKQVVKGKRTYVLTQAHYRNGRLYQPGERITVIDEAPGRTWVPLEEHLKKLAEERAAVEVPEPDVLGGRRAPNDLDL